MIELKKELIGKILDIGGGGEGVIGQLYGQQVTAIDNRQEELDEAPDCFKKVQMDATQMSFSNSTFDNVTSFYTLMFMDESDQQKALCESARVLKANGEIHIWDCDIDSAYPEPFCIDVEVLLPNQKIKTTYGVGKPGKQDAASIRKMCENAGFQIMIEDTDGVQFYLRGRKI